MAAATRPRDIVALRLVTSRSSAHRRRPVKLRVVKHSVNSRDLLIRVTADGADLLHSESGEKLWIVRWPDVEEIIAYKIDAGTVDHVYLAFRTREPSLLAVNEDVPGWKHLNEQLGRTFSLSFDNWFRHVVASPFAENRTTLWSHNAGCSFPVEGEAHDSQRPLNSFVVALSGEVLRRGFWIYVAEVKHPDGTFMYVGRTGDTSSVNAGSLFARIATHLEHKQNAKSNTLLRQLLRQQLAVENCSFRFVGIGPVFPQRATMEEHRLLRDEMAALERAVADILRERGYQVLGNHPKRRPVAPELLTAVIRELDRLLPDAA